jgi:hypothetical protein
MSLEEVQAIRRDLNDLRDEVHSWGGKIDLIHTAVIKMSRKTYVPGPPERAAKVTRSRSKTK